VQVEVAGSAGVAPTVTGRSPEQVDSTSDSSSPYRHTQTGEALSRRFANLPGSVRTFM
jgi:hypothetical protein